jgi:hypothetical protein
MVESFELYSRASSQKVNPEDHLTVSSSISSGLNTRLMFLLTDGMGITGCYLQEYMQLSQTTCIPNSCVLATSGALRVGD